MSPLRLRTAQGRIQAPASLSAVDVIALENMEDLQASLETFATTAEDLK